MVRGGLTAGNWVTTFKIQFGVDENDLHYIEDHNGIEVLQYISYSLLFYESRICCFTSSIETQSVIERIITK